MTIFLAFSDVIGKANHTGLDPWEEDPLPDFSLEDVCANPTRMTECKIRLNNANLSQQIISALLAG
jgi:hypothetical protein